jgi:hypothetical protein
MSKRDELCGYVAISGAGSWQEGGRVIWHGYWQLFRRNDDGAAEFVCRGRTGDLGGTRTDAATAGQIAGQAILANLATQDCAEAA